MIVDFGIIVPVDIRWFRGDEEKDRFTELMAHEVQLAAWRVMDKLEEEREF